MDRHILTIDPGLHSTGYAVWSMGHWSLLWPPVTAGCIKGPSVPVNHLSRAKMIAAELKDLEQDWAVSKAYVEFPVFYHSPGGHMAAATGDLQKICATAGVFAGALRCTVEPILVPEWKGQLPKPVVIERIKKLLTPGVCLNLKLKDDAWDAVGLGLFCKGYFK